MFGFLDNLLSGLGNTIAEFVNGLIVGALSFVDGVLERITHVESLIDHAASSVTNFFEAFLSLGHTLLPILPAEWSALIESALIVLAIGLLLRKKVVG